MTITQGEAAPPTGSTRVKAALIRRSRVDLEDERDELFARLDGCQDDNCPHHGDDVDRLDTVLWLLDGCES